MSATYEHRKVVAFVDSFKAANKNTVERVRKFDPKQKTWTFEIVKRDENVVKFSEDIKKSKRRQREKDKRQKTTPAKKNVIPAKPTVNITPQIMPQKPRSEMRLNVMRLHKDGLKFKEIGNLYGVSESSARTAYYREKRENENPVNLRQ
ncbi:hypothetical protein CLU96_1899 [Chryseobacterium sp. 52]|uniref:hypothetical protein n=1 Tax=Chryseobacterium sp. 52 TaxID=2035213 RepID=UPI000C1843AB|nr:hypothetical protein [Chryseobacterium sp. 52]PIF44902.1 hypothetical protein CLU96_1899 [Chryseobacterium sp. 52]